MRRAFLLSLLLAWSGCLPSYSTIRPATVFTVRGSDGHAIPNASVTVVSWSQPHHRLESTQTLCTDARGEARFERVRRWETLAPLVPHGIRFYASYWCVDASGFAPRTGDVSASPRLDVTLQPDASARSCDKSFAPTPPQPCMTEARTTRGPT